MNTDLLNASRTVSELRHKLMNIKMPGANERVSKARRHASDTLGILILSLREQNIKEQLNEDS